MLEKLNEFSEGHGALEPGRPGNYAAHFAFLDYLFGTAVKSTRLWPQAYGVLGDYVPNGFVKQLRFPFTWKG